MNQTFEIRCSNTRDARAGKVTCRRYLGKIDEHSITLICPRCSRRYLIVHNEKGGFTAVKLRDEKLLNSKPEKPKE